MVVPQDLTPVAIVTWNARVPVPLEAKSTEMDNNNEAAEFMLLISYCCGKGFVLGSNAARLIRNHTYLLCLRTVRAYRTYRRQGRGAVSAPLDSIFRILR